MPRLTVDPTTEICPAYEADDWATERQGLIAAHAGPVPLTDEAAVAQLRAIWQVLQTRKVTRWNQQLAEDQQAEDERREDEERRRAELEKEEEERRKELERKKPKLNPFDRQRRVGDWIVPRPSAFALNKLQHLEYVELDYFTPKGCNQAHAEHEKTSNHDTFSITRVDDIVALQPISSLKPSKNIRRDEELTWDEMVMAKNTMLHFISKTNAWPEEHVHSLAAFYVILETHPMRLRDSYGSQIVMNYAGRVRREWFDALKRDEGFNLELINEDLMRSIADEVKDAARKDEIKDVSTFCL
ncbi:hypothetical protein BDZ97DRAFT_1680327 [Flammula alnicola]|nr:hypothetical protein BDZ97DRAFT_1680327 [Flammula alnicola]